MAFLAAAATKLQVFEHGLRGLSPSCPRIFVQLGSIELNSPVVETSFESCFTGTGPTQFALTSLTKELLPDGTWGGHHTAKLQFGALETSRDGHG